MSKSHLLKSEVETVTVRIGENYYLLCRLIIKTNEFLKMIYGEFTGVSGILFLL